MFTSTADLGLSRDMRMPFLPFESLLAGVLTALPLGLWTTDLDLRFTTMVAGPGVHHQVAMSRAVVAQEGRRGFDLRYPQHPDVAAHLRARAGETVNWLTGWSGAIKACVAPLHGSDGAVVGVVGAAVDLSEVVEEERRRASSERLLYAFLEQGPCAASILDPDGRVVFANQLFLDAVGASAEEAIGNREQSLIPVACDDSLQDPDEWTSKAGNRRFRSRRLSVQGPGGAALTLHTALDVSEAIRLREQSEDRFQRYCALIESSPGPLAIVDLQQRVENVNEEFGRMLGLSQEKLGGLCLGRWISPCSREPYDAVWETLSGGQDVSIGQDLVFTDQSGKILLARVGIRTLRNESGPTATAWVVESYGEPATQMARNSGPDVSDLDGQVLERLAVGESNAEIADALCMSRQGLDYRIKQLRRRLSANSRGAIVARAYAQGLLSATDWPPRFRGRAEQGPADAGGRAGDEPSSAGLTRAIRRDRDRDRGRESGTQVADGEGQQAAAALDR
ncbi:PAS domain S-box-containing protein [Streptomyces aurantiacus]|uniref:PAS domain-containing protein n=1 Tax=Streptomyces aurantiacus TaxID=47760 RepID=UPI0027915DFE|nr:PAS domain-containing protein [Streptomyces aurantiacus]MDQ0771909.1 PAS domain S-box-containing protein [Streptomyces aurantiacus]